MKMTYATVVLGLALLAVGCSVSQDIALRADGSGSAELQISVHPVMVSYYNDLMVAMSGVEAQFPIFDLEALAAGFEARESVRLMSVEQIDRGSLRLAVSFTDIGAVFSDSREPVFTFERSGSVRTVTVRLDRAAIDGFLAFAPEQTVSMTQFLFPPADGSVSGDEFEEQMSWALEEYGSPEQVRAALRDAVIEVRVQPEGQIRSVQGGERRGQAAVFRIPVIEALTLTSPQLYSLSFSP